MESKGQVLIVDDRPYNLKRLSEILKASGYQVRTAINSDLAFLSACNQPPDMIICDVKTPGVEGLEFCRKLKENLITANVPVKFINTGDENSESYASNQDGTVEFIIKPFDPDDLLARVQTFIEFNNLDNLTNPKTDDMFQRDEEIQAQIEELQVQNEEIMSQKDELSCQNLLLNTILDNLPIGIFMIDSENGKPLIVSEHAKVLLGRGIMPDATSKNLHEIYKAYKIGSDQKYPTSQMPIILGTQEEHSHVDDMEVERPDGTRVVLEVFGCPVFDHNRKNWASLVGFYDITERKKSEQQINEAKEHFEKIFNLSPDAVLVTRLEDGCIINSNEGFANLTGYYHDEIVGKTTIDLCVWKNSTDRQNAVNHLKNKGSCSSFEVEIRHKDGSFKTVLWSANNITIQGVSHILSVAHDLTQIKVIEFQKLEMLKQMLHTQKLESIGKLAAGIGHDFNNLLTIIMSNLEYLNFVKIESPVVLKKIANTKAAAMRAATLTEQLLAYSGKGSYFIKELEINSLITKNLNLFKSIIEKHIYLGTNLHTMPLIIRGDENQLQQVVLNLLSNASEAIGEKVGIINIVTGVDYFDETALQKNLQPQKATPGNYVYIKVTDNGCGMDESLVKEIFEPFFSTKFVGRGLGLASVQGVIAAHLGGIFVNSTPNLGSSVMILLPACNSTAIQEQISIKKGDLKFTGTIIVADDEEMLLEISSEMLEMVGFKVLRATDGIDVIKLFKENHNIDGVLLDLTMPIMGGVATAKAIRERNKDIRVVFTSGYYASDKSLSLSSVAYDGFVHKPYEMSNLIDVMAQVFKDLLVHQKE